MFSTGLVSCRCMRITLLAGLLTIAGSQRVVIRPGPPGATSRLAATGPPGPGGTQGEPGYPGLQGPTGDHVIGPQGDKGDKGEVGDQPRLYGPMGMKGGAGDIGHTGPNGAELLGGTGHTGPRGERGPTGQPGPQGAPYNGSFFMKVSDPEVMSVHGQVNQDALVVSWFVTTALSITIAIPIVTGFSVRYERQALCIRNGEFT